MAYEEVDSRPEPRPRSEAVEMAEKLMAGAILFVPNGEPKPALHVLNRQGRLRKQRRTVRNGVEGTVYWAVEDERPDGISRYWDKRR